MGGWRRMRREDMHRKGEGRGDEYIIWSRRRVDNVSFVVMAG